MVMFVNLPEGKCVLKMMANYMVMKCYKFLLKGCKFVLVCFKSCDTALL